MKKLFVLWALACFGVAAVHATEVNDTTIMAQAQDTTLITSGEKVVIVTGDKPYHVKVVKKKKDEECKVHNISTHVSVGVNIGLGTPDGMSVKPFKSWDLNWTVFQYDYSPKKALQTYSAGVGIGWHNYGIGSGSMFSKDADGVVVVGDYPAGVSSKYSRFHSFSISVPLQFTQKFDRKGKYALSVGPVINFNVSGHLTTGYDQGDVEHNMTTKKIDYRPVTVDIRAIMKLDGIGIYARYSPMTVFKKDRGPEFRSLSLGLYF